MKKIYLFIICLIIFSFWIYIFRNYFLWNFETNLNNHIESNYIDLSIYNDDLNSSKEKELYLKKQNELSNQIKSDNLLDNSKIDFFYFPSNFESEILIYTNFFKKFLYSSFVSKKIDFLKVELYKNKPDVRWKMKNRTIKLFWVKEDNLSEYISVWIHELGHFIDLYYFKKQVFTDISEFYYNISWEWVNIIKSWQSIDDFVSWYSMTNQYEDFAESFTYYVLHNSDFLEKSKKSLYLKRKYDFFDKYLFIDLDFLWTDFSVWNEIEPYYRDITKIDFSLENFLDFLEK